MHSISWRIFVRLAITTVLTSMFAYGWIYWQAQSTEIAVRQRVLLDQAKLIASYLVLNERGDPVLNLPAQIADGYSATTGYHRYAVRDQGGESCSDPARTRARSRCSASSRRWLTTMTRRPRSAAHVRSRGEKQLGGRIFFTQVEEDGLIPVSQIGRQRRVPDRRRLAAGAVSVRLARRQCVAVRRALEPLKQVSRVAENIDPATADVRLPTGNVPQEILPLVGAINRALDRLEQGLMRQREFNANAAHQLRTPLAVLSANIEAMQDKTTAAKLAYDVELMSRTVNQLLLVARLETLSHPHNETVD